MSEWDATTYQRVSDPQVAWGRDVIGGVHLRGDETLLDAGCGTGRVTRLWAEAVPRGRVIAVDASHDMVREARAALADLAPRVEVRRMDLLELDVGEPVDVIVSTAVFHWVLDHEALFARLFSALAPGGRVIVQCGGAGNIARTLAATDAVAAREPYRAHLAGAPHEWEFADARTTARRLTGAGFTGVETWLHEEPADVGTVEDGARFLATVVLRLHLMRLPEHLRMPFATAVAERLLDDTGHVIVDYVRLEMRAHRPGGRGGPPGR
jgi:trans-aconitate 2-methyltransferase